MIPPLLLGNKLVTEFLVAANLFNDYFSQQCRAIDNNGSIPGNINFKTEERFSTSEIYSDDFVKIVRLFDPIKAYGHNERSIHMIKNTRFFNFKTTGNFQNHLGTVPRMNASLKNERKLT